MTTEQENTNIFTATIIAEKTIDGVIMQLFSNRIMYVKIPRFEKIGMTLIDAGYEFVEENGGGKFYNIYQFDSFSDVEPEVRDWASDNDGNHNTISDAIVIESLSQKIISDFYLRFNKPSHPTKVFYSLDKAVKWTLDQIKNNS